MAEEKEKNISFWRRFMVIGTILNIFTAISAGFLVRAICHINGVNEGLRIDAEGYVVYSTISLLTILIIGVGCIIRALEQRNQ